MATTLTLPVMRQRTPGRLLATTRQAEPRLFGLGLLMLTAMLPTLFAALVDPRTFGGEAVWVKPFKFELALAIYLFTLAFVARYLPAGFTEGRLYRAYLGAAMAAIVAEMIWIGGAAALGTASHFNPTPAGRIIYGAMGLAAVLLTSITALYAVGIARNRATALPPVLREAIVLGLALTLPLTLLTAGTTASMETHFVGAAASQPAAGLPLLGWARDGGDLRVAHFFATHAMHVVPAIGLASLLLSGPLTRFHLRLAAAAYVAFVLYTYVEALGGRAFLT